MVQFSSIRFGFRWKQALRGGIGAVLETDAKDLANALLFLLAWTSASRLSQERRGLGQLAVLEALVELLADGQGKAGDFAFARRRGPPERCIVIMRGNGNKDASRLKSYGRILNGFYVRLRNGDFIENRENGAGIKKAEIGAERQISPTLCARSAPP